MSLVWIDRIAHSLRRLSSRALLELRLPQWWQSYTLGDLLLLCPHLTSLEISIKFLSELDQLHQFVKCAPACLRECRLHLRNELLHRFDPAVWDTLTQASFAPELVHLKISVHRHYLSYNWVRGTACLHRVDNDALLRFARRFPKLQHLQLEFEHDMAGDMVTSVTPQGIVAAIETWPCLRVLRWPTHFQPDLDVVRAWSRHPRLQELSMFVRRDTIWVPSHDLDPDFWTELRVEAFLKELEAKLFRSPEFLVDWLSCLVSVRSLPTMDWCRLQPVHWQRYTETPVTLSRLEILNLANVQGLEEPSLCALVNHCPWLHTLRVSMDELGLSDDFSDPFLEWLTTRRRLRHIDLVIDGRAGFLFTRPEIITAFWEHGRQHPKFWASFRPVDARTVDSIRSAIPAHAIEQACLDDRVWRMVYARPELEREPGFRLDGGFEPL